jgi:flagellar motor switch protein FliM
MTIRLYDFTKPPPLAPGLRGRLSEWLGRSNALLAELLAAMPVSVTLRFEGSATLFPQESLSQWSDNAAAFRVTLRGCEAASVIALPNPLVQELVNRLLGDQPAAPPPERPLTPVELSIAALIVEKILQSLNDSWQADSPMHLDIGDAEPNLRRTKLYRPSEPMTVCRSIATTSATSTADSHWSWLLSNEFLARMFNLPPPARRAAEGDSSRRNMERLVRGMRGEIEIRLGGVQLTGPQLAALRVGDVVILDQRADEPLRASFRGEPQFLGWAGRVGNRQAFEIESGRESK